ncbi:ParA family protein [Spirosoma sordidisoli]|uniref:ParA family protein n=1 Tax=Spirosoma sordidisoli TaxID=2502893 RepID=A0A4V1RVE7_9BACT|nr:ParA family protein [Spirosoma sordidisoli]RYC66508.1 ParA family protein [Spirosoma sordidisoli]
MAVFISICTQKGGTGKTTLTMHMATYYHVVEKRNVIVLDADFPQHSFFNERALEIAKLRQDPELIATLQQQGRAPYEVRKVAMTDAPTLLDQLADTPDTIVFLDMPGTINIAGYDQVVRRLDYIILPMEADKLTFAAGMMTLDAFSKINRPAGKPLKSYLLWNKYKSSERQTIYESIETMAGQRPDLTILDTRVKDSVVWKNNRSTLFPYGEIKKLIAEINQKLAFNS